MYSKLIESIDSSNTMKSLRNVRIKYILHTQKVTYFDWYRKFHPHVFSASSPLLFLFFLSLFINNNLVNKAENNKSILKFLSRASKFFDLFILWKIIQFAFPLYREMMWERKRLGEINFIENCWTRNKALLYSTNEKIHNWI